jgi:hypothetical protein
METAGASIISHTVADSSNIKSISKIISKSYYLNHYLKSHLNKKIFCISLYFSITFVYLMSTLRFFIFGQ